jgi:ABC-2 type transport system ATP-binding protein
MSEATLPLEVRDLSKSFGDHRALDGVSLDLRAGEILGLLGPNGAGKTTLVRAVMGRVRPDSGSLRVFGLSASDPGASSLLGWVPQEIALYGLLSPRQNLTTFGRYQGLSGDLLAAAVRRNLEWTGLADRADERTDRLSGGMRRRLNIAAGTIHRPKLLLLDEPTVGVDPQSRERIYGMIEELKKEGTSLLYTTHYMEEAERLCDRIAIIDNGKIIALGTKEELVRQTLGGKQALSVASSAPLSEGLRQELARRGAHVEENEIHLSVEDPVGEIPDLLGFLSSEGIAVRDLRLKAPTLESVFLQLTGKELRE